MVRGMKERIKKQTFRKSLNKTDDFGVMKNWKKAKGIIARRGETNNGLAPRDYTIKCKAGLKPIIVFEGYHIWWCKTHQQPLPWCERKETSKHYENKIKELEKEIERLNKKIKNLSIRYKFSASDFDD